MKRGPRRANEHAQRYAVEGLPLGLTVAEWEVREGLPMFSVCPEAEHARLPNDKGRFMYCNASEAERAVMAQRSSSTRVGCAFCSELFSKKQGFKFGDICRQCTESTNYRQSEYRL